MSRPPKPNSGRNPTTEKPKIPKQGKPKDGFPLPTECLTALASLRDRLPKA